MRILLPVMIVVVISNYVAHLIYDDGIYEVLMNLKGYPYLDHSQDDCYDIFGVCDIMSSPVVTVREKERAYRLVELLRTTTHNGFPVVDDHGRFKGLVRRKQIIALIECGVFERDGPREDSIRKSIFGTTSGDRNTCSRRNHGLMNYAYFIKDDRFDHIVEVEENGGIEASILPTSALKEKDRRPKAMWNKIKKNMRLRGGDPTMPAVDISLRDDDSDIGIDGGGDDVDSDDEENENDGKKSRNAIKESSNINRFTNNSLSLSNPVLETPKGFAKVRRDLNKNVLVISWLNPAFINHVVDLEAVMNRGTYIVAEHAPLSKAYNLFTQLGLRWIVVVGGKDGGSVVGLLTRESFVESYLKTKTGVDARMFK